MSADPSSFPPDLEASRELCRGASADPDIELALVLHPPASCRAPVAEVLRPQGEAERAGLAGLETDPLEALELAHRPRRGSRALVDVELGDLIAGARAA